MTEAKRTPMMAQWEHFRSQHDKHFILAFRMGDFFEFFHDDARAVSKILDITCTDRQGVPLAGFPYASGHEALEKIVRSGRPVVVVDQVEDPATAQGRVVERDVVRIITPGTVMDENVLEKDTNNYIVSMIWANSKSRPDHVKVAVATCDISTGEFKTTSFSDTRPAWPTLSVELGRYEPVEVLVPDHAKDGEVPALVDNLLPGSVVRKRSALDFAPDEAALLLRDHFKVANLESFGIEGNDMEIAAAGALLRFLQEHQKVALSNINACSRYATSAFMHLDPGTVRNLEVLRNNADGTTRGSLYELFAGTSTIMGTRLVKKTLVSPLMDAGAITERLDCVEFFTRNVLAREALRKLLSGMCDIERLVSRVSYSTSASARHLVQLAGSLEKVQAMRAMLSTVPVAYITARLEELHDFTGLASFILDTFVDTPPAKINEGGMVRDGLHPELDELRGIRFGGEAWLEKFQETMRAKHGISTLKVKSNNVFGYFIEVSNTNKDKVPSDWTRKQTLVNAERYITPDLKAMEEKLLSAADRIAAIERDIFLEAKQRVISSTREIQDAARVIAELDVMLTFAVVSASARFTRPVLNEDGIIDIQEGRHPSIEHLIGADKFIPNDVRLDPSVNVLNIVTGPNMSGKSTFLRQICIITLLAQVGCFVPAKLASICIVDKVFSRVGAMDDITRQRSTFLVEMNETAYILNHATPRSLVILDELGRGTSTFDGVSLAWAVAEFLQARGVKTLFATHYHQLAGLEAFLPRTRNLNVVVREDEQTKDLLFLHKVVPGACDKSYGIQVAKLAGIPRSVIDRAQDILDKLSGDDPLTTDRIKLITERGITSPGRDRVGSRASRPTRQAVLFPITMKPPADGTFDDIKRKLSTIDVDVLTPVEALVLVKELKDRVGSTPGAPR